MKNKKFFHELTYGERFDIYNHRFSWDDTAKKFPQPPWCDHEQAVDGLFGCDDLWMGAVQSEKDCEGCRFYKNEK